MHGKPDNGNVPYVRQYIGSLRAGEQLLADALLMVSHRHERELELRTACRQLAKCSTRHTEVLSELAKRYGERSTDYPEQVRSALFHGVRLGGVGKLRDLHDLVLMGTEVKVGWASLLPAAGSLHDRELEFACINALTDTNRQLMWLQTQIEQTASHALTVQADKKEALLRGLPSSAAPTAFPEILWSPISGALLVLAVGLAGWIAGQPWLIPSLGPTAYLQAENPSHPSAKFYNTVVGHLLGLVAGFLAVAALNVWDDPVVLKDYVVTGGRAVAAAAALMLTLLGCLLLKASHPPAGATTLLVALGSVTTPQQAVALGTGVGIIACFGLLFRRIRLSWTTTGGS